MSIDCLFNPRGIALVGSVSKGRLGYFILQQILEGGYQSVYAVNPRGEGAFSAAGYTSVNAIEQAVDLAVIVSPAATVVDVLDDCGRAGVPAAIIITSGFSEIGNVEGEQAIKAVAQQHGIRFIGPNCAGIVNTWKDLYPTLEVRPPRGEVTFISQSGALGGMVLSWAEEQGLGFSKFVSYGNAADLNEIDFLEYCIDDAESKVVALYLESVTDGRAFMRAVYELTRRKPLVVIKSGRGQSGRRAALSHTGSMAGEDLVYDAVLRQFGAIRVESVEEMFDLCKGFVHLPPVRGKRVAIVTNSGGPGVLAADRAEEVGLSLPGPSERLREQLSRSFPTHYSLENPFDLTVEATEEHYRDTLVAVLQEYDAALAINVSPAYLDSIPLATGVCTAFQESGKPIVASFMAGRPIAPSLPHLKAGGVPNYASGERAVTVLAWMAEFENKKKLSESLPGIPEQIGMLPGEGQMLEPEVMTWLQQNGIPVPKFHFAGSLEEAVQASQEIGYPVVMKVVSPQILHKSDMGGVILGIRNGTQVKRAFKQLQGVAHGKDFHGVLLYPMIEGAQEVLVGLSRDAQFGPLILLGLGGIYTEVLRDIAMRVAPINRPQAEAMMRELKTFPMLEGIRGKMRSDIDALADLLVNVSRLPFLYADLQELDLNPVFLFETGLLVGDARAIRDL